MEEEKYDISKIVANIDKAIEKKAAMQKKPSKSVKPLKFAVDPEDDPIKAYVVKRINAKNLTYADICQFCTEKIRNNNIAEGQQLGYNIISGLKKRHGMSTATLGILCSFLNLDIMFVERKTDTSNDSDCDDDFADSCGGAESV